MSQISPQCRPLLIGSLPMSDHGEATELIFNYTPEFPLWPQLPKYNEEGMILQYLEGFPAVDECDGKLFIDGTSSSFDAEILAFYEEYLMIAEGGAPLDGSRFELTDKTAKGFFSFLDAAKTRKDSFVSLKGQTTGPVTFCTGLVDQDNRAIYYDDQLRDIAIKHLSLKARWQTKKMAEMGGTPIMFFDEPGLAGLGTSAFITITQEEIVACLSEVFAGVKEEQGLTGVHVCANTEWPVLFDAGVDIISYDAYSYFDRLVLYADQLVKFFGRGGMLATGIVPTSPEFIEIETVDGLVEKWFAQTKELVALGITEDVVYKQTFITPSCGTGAVSFEQAKRVLELTKGVSEKIRTALG
ncbi:uroporphyrinogen decarboxylase/cobalamine-independent methonine synthase family protein [Desulforhopalus sp. 52FAK]